MKKLDEFKNNFLVMLKKLTRKDSKTLNIIKICVISVLAIGILTRTYSWLYEEYVGNGVGINFGKISHLVTHYDDMGNLILDGEQTQTLLYETNMSNITKGTKYIKIENDGTLDLEYTLSFNYEGTVSNVGVLYYRLYEITDLVNNAGSLSEYAKNNVIPDNVETDSTNPVKNMSLINKEVYQGEILLDPNGSSAVYYRLDYGMYQTVNTSLYSNESMSLHMNVYSTQIGATDESVVSGQIWQVSNEEQLREILISAVNGDTIQLVDDIDVAGTINLGKRINLDTNEHTLNISGDLVYDFANMGELLIDVTGEGKIIIGNNFYVNTPKAEVDIIGGNKSYDIVVTGETVFNGIQDGEKDGIYLESLNIVNSITTLVPADVIVKANTRMTVSSNVNLGTVSADVDSTNIEIINNGNIVQLNFSKMSLIKTFTKAQIYVYNLGNIYGIVGSTSIVLPPESTPYLGPNNGNTWIVKGITSNDITISGSDNFDSGDIEDNMDDVYVVPIDGEDNSYIVYIKDSVSSVEGLLVDYFNNEGYERPYEQIYEIRKLVIYTMNAQYFENEDFEFLKSDLVPYLKHLDLSNSRVIDGDIANKIKDNAMSNKTSLKELVLPSTLTNIGNYAFSGVSLGNVPNNDTEGFYFVTIPSSVSTIGEYAFDNSEFIFFESNNPPSFYNNTFNYDKSKIFVNGGAISEYLELDTIRKDRLYQKGVLSDDKRYIIFDYYDGIGISYVINDIVSTSTLGIPSNIYLNGSSKRVYVIGINSYRHMDIYLETGVFVNLPSSVIRIDNSAFRDLNINNIGLNSVIEIGDYAFSNTKIDMLKSNSIEIIGSYAFSNTKIQELSLSNIYEIGSYAFSNVIDMYSAYLYNVSIIGSYAFENCKYLNKVYFTNKNTLLINNGEDIDITVGTDSLFNNWGFYTDGRLRVYVPDGKTEQGNTYLSLYQKKFNGNENYIFVTGYEIGSYKHLAVPYDINIYTVREVDLYGVNGWEIVSYQGEDLGSNYVIPETLTYNGVTKSVISIGDYAYRNVLFKDGETIDIENSSLVKLGNYAFSNMDITNIKIDSLKEIGPYALYGTILQKAEFVNLETLGDYGLAELLTLNMVNLGTIKNIGYSAMYNDANLEQIFINNKNYDIVLGQNSFYNVGVNATNRFRMYVPGGETSLNYYKTLFVNYENYIYETGVIVGSYVNAPIMYDIGEYSVKEVTLKDRDGNDVSGYELIEYHGADLSNLFDLPDEISLDSGKCGVVLNKTGGWASSNVYNYTYEIVLTNKTDKEIASWKLKVDTSDIVIDAVYNTNITNYDGYAIVSSANTWQSIPVGGSITLQMQFHSSKSDAVLNATYYDETTDGIPLISIGENAFINTKSNTNTNIVLDNKYLINIGTSAFNNITGITKLDLPMLVSMGDYAFYNNSLNVVEAPSLKSIGSYALSNMSSLYYINLGKVIDMKENALYNLNNLLQVYFTPTDETIVFDSNSINNVGGLTDDRIRFYVGKLKQVSEEEKTENVNLSIDYTSSYTTSGNNNNRRYIYTITATVSNPSNKSITSWSTKLNLGNNEQLQNSGTTGVTSSTAGSMVTFISDGSTSTIEPLGSVEFTFVVSVANNRSWSPTFSDTTGISTSIEMFESNIEVVNLYKNSFNEKYKDYFYTKGEIIGKFTPSNIPFEIGEYSVDYITYTDSDGKTHYGFEIIEWHGDNITSDFKIPNEITIGNNTLSLISIGDYGFRWANMNSNEVINIDSTGLLRIDDYAFYNVNVYTLNTPNIDVIGDYAFYNNSLYTVNLPNLYSVGDYSFANNKMLNYMNLGNVSVIGKGAFENLTGLEQIFFTNKNVDTGIVKMNMTIGDNAFDNIATQIGKRFRIYVPDGEISTAAEYKDAYKNTLPSNMSDYIYETGILVNDYYYNVLPYNIYEFSVKEITINNTKGYKIIEYHGPDITSEYSIPASITVNDETKPILSIGKGAYVGVEVATGETWDLVLPSTIVIVEDRAFYKTPISSLYSDATIETIGVEAFAECPNLTNVNLGTVNYILEKAFNLNTKLVTVRLGTDVVAIGSKAFYNTSGNNSLTRFYIATVDPPLIEADTFPAGETVWIFTFYDTYFYVPRQSVTNYQEATNWSTRRNYINSSADLYDNTYYYSKNDTTMEVNIVEYIGNSNGTLTIPDTFTIDNKTYNVTSIDGGAFDSTSVTTLVLPRYLTSLGEGFLDDNTTITNIDVNSNNILFKSINGVLYDGMGETLIRYPRARTEGTYTLSTDTKVLANGSFANAPLTTINFNSGLLAIGTGVFSGATSLTRMNFTSTNPPYLMGFGSFPTNYNLVITYPSGSENAYTNNLFYNSYRNYLRSN